MRNLSLLFFAFLFLQFTSLAQYGWFEQTSGTTNHLNSVFFVNSNLGWAVGEEGTIIHTTDGGNNWIPQTSNLTENLTSIRFTDENTGWINVDMVQAGQTLKTTNRGQDWFLLNAPSGPSYFLTNNIGWIFHGQTPSHFIKTTDGGLSWDTLHTWEPYAGFYISDLYFVNENLGFMNGVWEGMNSPPANMRTTDGGSNWNGAGFLGNNISLCFVDDNAGWACINPYGTNVGASIGKTQDAGENWVDQFTGYYIFSDIYFANYDKGWTVEGDSIWCTTDGGENWSNQVIETTEYWHAIHFVDENNGWVVGNNGKIVHTISGGVVSVKEEQITSIPTEYSITQNYPNPFNPSTKIRYSVPQLSKVVINVFDILGNEIETLVNEEKLTGTYELTWYAEQLPSGIYFYRLKAVDPSTGSGQGFVETKKMILMK